MIMRSYTAPAQHQSNYFLLESTSFAECLAKLYELPLIKIYEELRPIVAYLKKAKKGADAAYQRGHETNPGDRSRQGHCQIQTSSGPPAYSTCSSCHGVTAPNQTHKAGQTYPVRGCRGTSFPASRSQQGGITCVPPPQQRQSWWLITSSDEERLLSPTSASPRPPKPPGPKPTSPSHVSPASTVYLSPRTATSQAAQRVLVRDASTQTPFLWMEPAESTNDQQFKSAQEPPTLGQPEKAAESTSFAECLAKLYELPLMKIYEELRPIVGYLKKDKKDVDAAYQRVYRGEKRIRDRFDRKMDEFETTVIMCKLELQVLRRENEELKI
ncbi:unnamed protein product [Bemisia tabaci]|uniref:Uncharacterized protein n=1 Tax=Bemisia tabaci TaxID=7038 RepID=A0A9P0FAS6_BEMTA|nr:unnamed protein product [Bemisia tabaci]